MKRRRMIALLVLLASVLVIRRLDPLREQGALPAVAAVDREHNSPAHAAPRRMPALEQAFDASWPVRAPAMHQAVVDAFYNRAAVRSTDARPLPTASPSPPIYVPQPQPAAPVVPIPQLPQLDIIGTWHQGQDHGVFVSTPQGTLLLRPGDQLSAGVEVRQITPDTLELMDIVNQRPWRIAIPSAPSSFTTWPAR